MKATEDLDKYPKAMELFNVILKGKAKKDDGEGEDNDGDVIQSDQDKKYDGVESTFESLDKQAKLILVQNIEMTNYLQYTVYLAEWGAENMDAIDKMFSPIKNLLAALKRKL